MAPAPPQKDHCVTLEKHGWSHYFDVDLLDGEGPDLELPHPERQDHPGKTTSADITKYDSMLVLSHFKGHAMGGYGGALKQLSIGVASAYGKSYIHGAGHPEKMWSTDQDLFLSSMADAASSVINFFKGQLAYVNVMKEHIRRLRLRQQRGAALHEGHRHPRFHRPGCRRPGLP